MVQRYVVIRPVCHFADDCRHHSLVVFRMVVFRPFTSEVILAKVKSSDQESIRCQWPSFCIIPIDSHPDVVSLGFFDDIYIPAMYLPQPTALSASCPSPASVTYAHYTVTQQSARTSGSPTPNLRPHMNYSTPPLQNECTSTKTRSSACASKQTSSTTMNRGHGR